MVIILTAERYKGLVSIVRSMYYTEKLCSIIELGEKWCRWHLNTECDLITLNQLLKLLKLDWTCGLVSILQQVFWIYKYLSHLHGFSLWCVAVGTGYVWNVTVSRGRSNRGVPFTRERVQDGASTGMSTTHIPTNDEM